MAFKLKYNKGGFPFKSNEDRPEPTWEGTDEYRKKEDIPESEYKKRGIKNPNTGKGFMNPPYRGPEGKGPTEKRQGYHGFKNFKSNLTGKIYTAPDGTKHTGQVSDYEIEKKEDLQRKTKK